VHLTSHVHGCNKRTYGTPEVEGMYILSPLQVHAAGKDLVTDIQASCCYCYACSGKQVHTSGTVGVSVSTHCRADRIYESHRCISKLIPRA